MKQTPFRILALVLALPFVAAAQSDSPAEPPPPPPEIVAALPDAVLPVAVAEAITSQTTQAPTPVAVPQNESAATPASGPSASSSPAPAPNDSKPVLISVPPTAVGDAASPTNAPSQSAIPSGKGEIRLNFQNASLTDVLNFLSEAAGFVIVQEVQVAGTVSIVSRQPINADEAVDLLNSVLVGKGYTAIRNGRILKIVSRSDVQKRDLPVMAGSDPTQIPRKDQVVTQILPVRYLEAAKLVENLRPLLPADATISANESSNAILLGDTQTNIHRIAEIIRALDTSVSSISTIHVYPLQYADSKQLANVLTQLFATDATARTGNQQGGRGRGGFGGFSAMFGGGGGGDSQQSSQSPAQQAATRVVAVSDEQSNSVIVSAPDEVMATISEIVSRLDTNIADVRESRIFRLERADAAELANVLTTLYADDTTTSSRSNSNNNGGFRPPWMPQPQASTSGQRSERALLQSRVVAVADPRTNSLVVTAARDTMAQIALTVGRLDASDSKKQHVYIHRLENADPDNVAAILRGMFGDQSASSSNTAQPSSNRLNQRTSTGASSDVTDIMNNTSTGRSGSR